MAPKAPPQSAAAPLPKLTPQEVTQMEALVQRIDAINTRMTSQAEGGVDSSGEDMDVISEGQRLMATSFGRFVENDALARGSVAKLGQSLSTCASTVKETVKRMGARAQS